MKILFKESLRTCHTGSWLNALWSRRTLEKRKISRITYALELVEHRSNLVINMPFLA